MDQVLPAEWEPHTRCLMAWTGQDMVSTRLSTAVKVDYDLVARAISSIESLLVNPEPGFGREEAAYCPDAEILEHPLEDAWLRDSGPLFVRRGNEGLAAVDFLFNGWGQGETLGTVGEAIAAYASVPRQTVPLVLEGGSITVDGQGTLIAIAPTVLHANRNDNAPRTLFETAFREYLGVRRTVWLEHGLREDRTGGHVDNVALFIGPNTVACQTTTPEDPNHAGLSANLATLRAEGFDAVELPTPYRQWAGRRIALPYVNLYLANGCAVVPLAGAPTDAAALQALADALPGREIVGVPASNLWRRGGGPHCITQPQPE